MTSVDLQVLWDAVSVAVVVHEADGRVAYANAAALAMFGIEFADIAARTVAAGWDVRGLDGRPVPVDTLPGRTALLTGERQVAGPFDVGRPDGSRVWVNAIATPLPGPPPRVAITFTDASNERALFDAARADLARQERFLEHVLGAMTEGLVLHAPGGAIRYGNDAAARILGLSRAQLLGREAVDPRWRLVRWDGSPLPPGEIPSEQAARTGRAVEALLGVDRSDGARAWLRVTSAPIASPGEPSEGVVATFADITELREAQLAAERALARQAAINAAMPGLVFQFQIDGDGRRWFPYIGGQLDALAALRGLGPPLPFDAVRALVLPEDLPGFQAALERSRARRTLFDELVRVTGPAGLRWLRLRAEPEPIGAATLWTGVALDVTEEQHLAEAVRRAQRRDAMGDLAAGIAHNFNNMLAVIAPNIDAARERAPAVEPLLGDAAMAATRAAELVRQLLFLARGTAATALGTADLVEVVRDAASLCRRTFDRAIEIETVIAPDLALAPTRGSLGHLEQVVVNLCINARDALESRPAPRIELHLARVDAPLGEAAAHFELRVRDNGRGMPPEVVARLGEPFFTTKPPGRGTGLGLATVYNTLRDLGGAVEVMSAPGEGTTFVLRCPIVETPVAVADGTAPIPTLASRRVLVVEDEELVRRVVRRQLERHGHQVEEASSGADALRFLERGMEVDVILLDLSMPGMSGAETLRQIRARGAAPPVIIVSGDASARPDLEGAAAVLQKPVPRAALLAAIAEVTHPRE